MAASKKGREERHRRAEYRFEIKAYTPETMPMARLAEYMRHLADVLGEPNAVHFMRVRGGSCVGVLHIENEALPKVRERADAVVRGTAPRDALEGYRAINKKLREDNGYAVLREKGRTARLLRFPGRQEGQEPFTSKQPGSVAGSLCRIGGSGNDIRILLESEGEQIAGLYTTRAIAKKLAMCLFEPVRLSGVGTWERDADGVWKLGAFRVDSFEPLDATPLSETLAKLRVVNMELPDDAYEQVKAIRDRRPDNGGH